MYSFFTADEIKPNGWLKNQLQIQADGLSGNLDKIWPDIKCSAWIGKEREGWERVPYWLDGFIPLAYLLDNDDMKTRAEKYIDAILSRQQSDGWICPCKDEERGSYDTWALLLLSKVFLVYYRCSHDERIPSALYRMMNNYYQMLESKTIRLFDWGRYRWFEGFEALDFLKERYNEEWIDKLAKILYDQGFDYREAQNGWKEPEDKWTFENHIVNLAMMLKAEAVTFKLSDDKLQGEAEHLYSILMEYNGTPTGIFTGDECLSGLSPIQGTELCAVAEIMYSFELLYAYSCDPLWAERLEKVAFNALPAAFTDDMWAHQYDQMSNQIAAVELPHDKRLFRTNDERSHLFGLEPNFGCCTANFNQAWPKLALSSYMRDGDTVISALTVPCTLKTDGISVSLDTEYPFKSSLNYHIETEKDFTLKIRIPSFAENLTLNGKSIGKTDMLSLRFNAGQNSDILVKYEIKPQLQDRPYNLKTVTYGSLIFSLPIEFDKKMIEYTQGGVERKYPYCDYELYGKSEWRYGLIDDNITVCEEQIGSCPFSSNNPPIKLSCNVSRINWELEKGFDTVAAKVPADTKATGKPCAVDFYPYGCSKLRITELPMCK